MALGSRAHVVVIGGGLAGLSAANEALKHGAMVTMVEKETLTGNSAKATSGVNAVETKWQQAKLDSGEIEDGVELFYNDIMRAGHWKNKPDLALTLAALSGNALDTMAEDFNLSLSDIQQLGGHNARRTHRFPPRDGRVAPVGWTIVAALKKAFLSHVDAGNAFLLAPYTIEDFQIENKQSPYEDEEKQFFPYLTSILLRNVKDNSTQIITNPNGLIITTGGFAALSTKESILGRVRPDLIGYPSTNGPFSTGDALLLAERKNLSLIHLEYVQVHPTGFIDPKDPGAMRKFLCPEVMRGVGGILIGRNGKRFVNELLPRDKLTEAINKYGDIATNWGFPISEENCQKIVLMIMDEDVAQKFGIEAFKFYLSKGFINKVENLEEFQNQYQIPNESFKEAVANYNRAVDGSQADDYDKTFFPGKIDITNHFYVAYITPALHFTMGGIEIDPTSRAMTDGTGRKVVTNLFVAGETAGGVHGANRLGGNGCLESAVFGQLAGRLAANAEFGINLMHLKGELSLVVESISEDNIVSLILPSISSVVVQEQIKMEPNRFLVTDRNGVTKGQVIALRFFTPRNRTGIIQVKVPPSTFKIYPGLRFTGLFI